MVGNEVNMNYTKFDNVHVIEIDPLTLGCWVVDAPAHTINIANFATGGYWGLQKDGKTYSTGHLVNDGKILSNVATHGLPVSTVCVFYDGAVQVKPIKDISLERGLKFAISGTGIYPENRLAKEGFVGKFADVARKTGRVILGYNPTKNKIIVIAGEMDIETAQTQFKKYGVTMGITLDGGGSTVFRVGDFKIKTTRRINNVIMWG